MSAVCALSGSAFTRLASAGARRTISNRSALRATAANRQTKARASTVSVSAAGSFHDFKGKTCGAGTRAAPTEGSEVDFASFKGKVVLINNVATM